MLIMGTVADFIRKEIIYVVGIMLIVISFGIFISSKIFIPKEIAFCINYFICIAYVLLGCIISKKQTESIGTLEHIFIALVLFLISAFSLNNALPLLELPNRWVQVIILIMGIVLILPGFKNHLPQWIQILLFGILGVGFMLFLYFSIILIPIYPFAALALFILGLSLHAFVPLMLIVFIPLYVFHKNNRKRSLLISFTIGVLLAIICVITFIPQWSTIFHFVEVQDYPFGFAVPMH
jgi:hypothetical protein